MEWRVVEACPAYMVSEYGDVKRITATNGATIGRILKGRPHAFGYPRYALSYKGKYYHYEAHRLVAPAFLGPKPEWAEQIAHLDGNPKNNHYSNLKWVTQQENESHKFIHNTNPKGEKNAQAKLNEDAVRSIRKEYIPGKTTLSVIAEKYGIKFQTVSKIANLKSWKHVA